MIDLIGYHIVVTTDVTDICKYYGQTFLLLKQKYYILITSYNLYNVYILIYISI